MAGKRVLKWSVEVDDQFHPIGGGRVVGVECQSGPAWVQVWTEEASDTRPMTRTARVYETGQEVPRDMEHVGMAMTTGGLVWHVYVGDTIP